MAIKKFRRGETTYTCRVCKKLTRNTGGDEIQCQLCIDCFDLAGFDNHRMDEGAESMVEHYGGEAKVILKRRPELSKHFPEIAEAVNKGVER